MNCWRRAGSRPARPSASYGGSIKRRARFRLSQTRLASTERARRSGRWQRSRLAHACSLWTESRSAIWINGFLSQLTQKSSSRDWFRSPAASLPNKYSAARKPSFGRLKKSQEPADEVQHRSSNNVPSPRSVLNSKLVPSDARAGDLGPGGHRGVRSYRKP